MDSKNIENRLLDAISIHPEIKGAIDRILDDSIKLAKSIDNTSIATELESYAKNLLSTFHVTTYSKFAYDTNRKETFLRKERIWDKEYDVPIPFNDLDDKQLDEWKSYLKSENFKSESRELFVKSLYLVPRPMPSAKHDRDAGARNLLLQLTNAYHSITNYFIPDITDKEAQKIFGEYYISEMVNQKVTDENAKFFIFYFEGPVLKPELQKYHQTLKGK